MTDIERAMSVAKRAAEEAGRAALAYWNEGVTVEKKADRSPVTVADREAEAKIIATIRAELPEDAILTEESGVHEGNPRRRWIIDPLDGTRGFTRGGMFWGPLVAFELDGEVVAGAMVMPAMDLVYWAGRGFGAHRNGTKLSVSGVDDLGEATLSLGEMAHLMAEPHGPRIVDLIKTAASTRGYGDLAGCALVLDGKAEVWLEAGVKPWDIAATKVLIEEAGGRFTNFGGTKDLDPGTAIASNGRLHDAVLDRLRT
jgi:histidinol-phosphatase